MKKYLKYLLIFLIIYIFTGCHNIGVKSNDYTYKTTNVKIDDIRGHYTSLKGEGNDKVTIMFYIIGSDLESEDGNATNDIKEILDADLSNVNVVFQTGGTKNWHNKAIKNGITQRHIVQNGKFKTVVDLGKTSMVNPQTLTDFVNWSTYKYPANRNILIFWNHGGGTLMGYGYDENDKLKQLSLGEIGGALRKTGVKFDIVGFDACLMGTIETAYMLAPYADYLIGSEENEAESGWFYTNWLNILNSNTSVDSIALGKQIINDYIKGPDAGFSDINTLSLIELREVPYVYEKLCKYMAKTTKYLDNTEGFAKISDARSKAISFGDNRYEQIDIISYLNNIEDNSDEKQELLKYIKSAVKYTNSSMLEATGLAMYYPYEHLEYYQGAMEKLSQIGFSRSEEIDFFNKFLSIISDGKIAAYKYDFDNVKNYNQGEDYQQYDWFDSSNADKIEIPNFTDLKYTKKNGKTTFSLTDDEWKLVTSIGKMVYIDDGKGYIYMGYNDEYNVDKDNNIIVDYNYRWAALDGLIVPFYRQTSTGGEKDGVRYGYSTAILNDTKEVEVVIYGDDNHKDGYVKGYRLKEDTDNLIAPKGLKEFKKGDKLEFVCDYYDYEGIYDKQYSVGSIEVGNEIVVSNKYIGNYKTQVCFKLSDIYKNDYYTELVAFTSPVTIDKAISINNQ